MTAVQALFRETPRRTFPVGFPWMYTRSRMRWWGTCERLLCALEPSPSWTIP